MVANGSLQGFRKKLEAEMRGNWQKSIINHLHWCVASTKDADANTILAKWLSLENYIHNKHTHTVTRNFAGVCMET